MLLPPLNFLFVPFATGPWTPRFRDRDGRARYRTMSVVAPHQVFMNPPARRNTPCGPAGVAGGYSRYSATFNFELGRRSNARYRPCNNIHGDRDPGHMLSAHSDRSEVVGPLTCGQDLSETAERLARLLSRSRGCCCYPPMCLTHCSKYSPPLMLTDLPCRPTDNGLNRVID